MEETLFDDWDEPVVLTDSNQVIRRANKPAAILLGFGRTDLYGLPLRHILPFIRQERFEWMRQAYGDPNSREFGTAVPTTAARRDDARIRVWATFEHATIRGRDCTWVLLDGEGDQYPADTRPWEDLAREPESVKGIQVTTADFGHRAHASDHRPGAGPVKLTDTEITRLASDLLEVLDFNILATGWPETESGTAKLGKLVHRDIAPTPERSPGSSFPLAGTFTEEVLRSRAAVLVRSERKADLRRRFPGAEPDGRRTQFPSNMCIPIFAGTDIVGLVGIHSIKHAYRPEHLEKVSLLLNQRFGA